jgi:hypothetical protein
MKKIRKCYLVPFFILPFLFLSLFAENSISNKMTAKDVSALKVCEGVIQLFKRFPDSVWPGYNLAKQPFLVYMPGEWALLFNYSIPSNGFKPYPEEWPDLGTKVLFYPGRYNDLAGQLVFNLSIDSAKVVAVPFMEKSMVDFFAYIVHEAFHQYQSTHFGEIPWEREEKYPIHDRNNTALAYIEMRLLMDALQRAGAGDAKSYRQLMEKFVAVRNYRWQKAEPFVANYEKGQEINEGTAKYVEMKSIEFMTNLKYKSSFSDSDSQLLADFAKISMPGYLLKDFQDRFLANSISPTDMPRNRIYPVGCALGFLADYFKINWKEKAQQAGPEFTFTNLFQDCLTVPENQFGGLVAEAKQFYDFEKVLASTDDLIKKYLDGYGEALKAFEAQSGYRIEIELNSNGVSRSRSSSAPNWLIDKGTKELRAHYDIYTLKKDDLLLQVHDSGVFEKNNWEAKIKNVSFFVPEITSFFLDEKALMLEEDATCQFKNIKLTGKNFEFNSTRGGALNISGRKIKIILSSSSPANK